MTQASETAQPHYDQPTKEIPSYLKQQIIQFFLDSGFCHSHGVLRAIFTDQRISILGNSVPEASNSRERAAKLFDLLIGFTDEENMLINFLAVVRDLADPEDAIHSRANDLILQLEIATPLIADQRDFKDDNATVVTVPISEGLPNNETVPKNQTFDRFVRYLEQAIEDNSFKNRQRIDRLRSTLKNYLIVRKRNNEIGDQEFKVIHDFVKDFYVDQFYDTSEMHLDQLELLINSNHDVESFFSDYLNDNQAAEARWKAELVAGHDIEEDTSYVRRTEQVCQVIIKLWKKGDKDSILDLCQIAGRTANVQYSVSIPEFGIELTSEVDKIFPSLYKICYYYEPDSEGLSLFNEKFAEVAPLSDCIEAIYTSPIAIRMMDEGLEKTDDKPQALGRELSVSELIQDTVPALLLKLANCNFFPTAFRWGNIAELFLSKADVQHQMGHTPEIIDQYDLTRADYQNFLREMMNSLGRNPSVDEIFSFLNQYFNPLPSYGWPQNKIALLFFNGVLSYTQDAKEKKAVQELLALSGSVEHEAIIRQREESKKLLASLVGRFFAFVDTTGTLRIISAYDMAVNQFYPREGYYNPVVTEFWDSCPSVAHDRFINFHLDIQRNVSQQYPHISIPPLQDASTTRSKWAAIHRQLMTRSVEDDIEYTAYYAWAIHEWWQEKGQEQQSDQIVELELPVCPYCGQLNLPTALKCASEGASLAGATKERRKIPVLALSKMFS